MPHPDLIKVTIKPRRPYDESNPADPTGAKAESRDARLVQEIRALIAKWIQEAERHEKHGDSYRRGQGWGLRDCADELLRLLRAAASALEERAEPQDECTTALTMGVCNRGTAGCSKQHRYWESDRDFVENNMEAAVTLLEIYSRLYKEGKGRD